MHQRLKFASLLTCLSIILLISVIFGVCIGETPIALSKVIGITVHRFGGMVGGWTASEETIVLMIRFPRVILAAIVGSGLAISGAVLQSLFRNPMADPFILGISNGAAFGASVVMLLGISLGIGIFDLPVMAFICGTLTIMLVYRIAIIRTRIDTNTLLLSGIAVSSFMAACTSLLLFLSNENLHQIIFWMMGGLWGRSWEHVVIAMPFVVLGTFSFFIFARPLNALMFGEESAHYLGIQVDKLKKVILAVTTIVTGAVVAVSGIIGFVGLIIPHVVRLVVGPDHRVLLPLCSITGAIFLIIADLVSRIVIAPAELPIGVITAMCGAPFFIYLLKWRSER